jgi:hypothetical protein
MGVRLAPVISHVRQVSFVARGSALVSASGIFQYSVVLETPGGFETLERGSGL